MIANVNTGICQSRLQLEKPCYFVNWNEDGENKYEFFNTIFQMYSLKKKLQAEIEKLNKVIEGEI